MKFCIALYNLHLSDNVPPTPEENKRLIHTIWLNYTLPQPVLGNQQTAEKLKKKPVFFVTPGYLFFKVKDIKGYSFHISLEDFNYLPPDIDCPDIDWWERDYPSFLEEYAHLRSFIDGYLKGQFRTKDRVWLDRALQFFTTKLVDDYGNGFTAPLEQMDAPFPTLNGKRMSDMVKTIDITYVKAKLCPNLHQMTANAILLFPAYLEIVETLEENREIRRCQAPQTQKTPACQNIFRPQAKGKKQKYCSTECANRARRREYYLKKRK